jgi:hypothetical protein
MAVGNSLPQCATTDKTHRPGSALASDDVTEVPDAALITARADLDRLVRRLRRLTPRAWSTGGREEHVRALAAALVAIGAPGHDLPPVARHALPDVVAVVGQEALDVEGAAPAVRTLLLHALDVTR